MFKTGLVSISFRRESVEDILTACGEAGLQCVEWGGDIHVPAGDITRAEAVMKSTRGAGLSVASYGSYYKAGADANSPDIDAVLKTAHTLGAPVVRIWCGTRGSKDLSTGEIDLIAAETLSVCQKADALNIDIGLECHPGTLTDDYRVSLEFLNKVNHKRLFMYWQPNQHRDLEYNLEAAAALSPFVNNIHVFHWDETSRYPLKDGADVWRRYIEIFAKTNKTHTLLLEFMHDDNIATLKSTAKALHDFIK